MSTNTITRTDIEAHIAAAIGDDWADLDATLEAVTDAVLEAAPLSSWALVDLDYVSTLIDAEGLWKIVEAVTAPTISWAHDEDRDIAVLTVEGVEVNSGEVNPAIEDDSPYLEVEARLIADAGLDAADVTIDTSGF